MAEVKGKAVAVMCWQQCGLFLALWVWMPDMDRQWEENGIG